MGVLIWNIHGLKNEKVDTFRNKSESVVTKIFDENDIICLTETWRDRNVLSWDDKFSEQPKNANRQSKRGRSSGGTTIFVKNEFQSYGNNEKQDAYHVNYKLDKGHVKKNFLCHLAFSFFSLLMDPFLIWY